MRNQTTKKAPFNRGDKGTNNALRSIWLRGLDSNQRPSGYTFIHNFNNGVDYLIIQVKTWM